jgi:type II secretory pathway component PulF
VTDKLYAFKAMDADNSVIEGLITAPSPRAARVRVMDEVGRVIALQEIVDEAEVAPEVSMRGVTHEQLSSYTRQLGLLVRSGIHLQRALKLVAGGESIQLNIVFMWMASDIDRGHSLSHALSKFPRVFNSLYVSLVEAAEVSGLLDANLARLSDVLDQSVRLRRRLASTFAYPLVISAVAVVVLGLFVWFILPTVRPSYEDMGIPLPWLTRAVLSVTDLSINPWVWIVGAPLAWLGCRRFLRYARSEEGRVRLEARVRGIPLLGATVDKQEVVAVLYILATLLDAGISLGTAIRSAARAGTSVRMARGLTLAEDLIMRGHTVTEAFAGARIFPAAVIHMMQVGEESGTTGRMLACAIRLFEFEIDRNLSTMASLLEPLVMLGVGVLVGIITLAAFLPSITLVNRI